MVLKPSEIAPLDAIIFAEILDEAGVPAGVFNLVNAKAADAGIPFGGYKQSGNGREYAEYGLEDFRETKGILGYASA